ncbi:Stk1 family PASTA domain-containing Ser/Thr kinase [Rhodococcus sp. X156]|uniref:Stk1 family PASTA domain-containing Ser/Thr kinase n=1 Tax=Rhodococcus sp. X156 TaxID=2499145 RepID=UPI000FDC295A|nr:Stk1 family PASTA domain-containing Ser/Thr kinase [Rhodococcus sp. X156]
MSTPRRLSDRYELGETLGFGGMSEVHRGVDLRLHRDVAVKVLRADLAREPSFYLRFRREAQNAAALNHPAIVAVYDTGEAHTDEGPLPYIVMEYVDGETLRDLLRAEGPLSPRRAMEIMADVCAALDFSHRHGIIHRDVKPANVMIDRAGAVKVMDFGIARAIADGASTMTQTAAVIGTAQYLSPEQARGDHVDARSDVYAAGCVLYELITGEPPFTGDSPVAVAVQHVREDPRPPSTVHANVPATLDSIVLKAMSKNPANRYQSAGEMRGDLVRVLGGNRPTAPSVMTDAERDTILGPTGALSAASRRARAEEDLRLDDNGAHHDQRRRKGLLAALAVALVAVLALVGVFAFAYQSGPVKTTVPDVRNQPLAVAETMLSSAGFSAKREFITSATVEKNSVVDSAPPVGSSQEKGSVIILRVSSGPPQATVPQVNGLSLPEATAALTNAGFTVAPNPGRAVSSAQLLDKVVDSNPRSGTQTNANGTVALVLGSGPQLVPVPQVVGLDVGSAQGNLKQLQFASRVENVDSSAPQGKVVAQQPAAGGSVAQGSTVTLSVSRGNRVAMPDLVGITTAAAQASLEAAGWKGGSAGLSSTAVAVTDQSQQGLVQGQSITAGTDIDTTTPIAITVGRFQAPTTTPPAPTTPPEVAPIRCPVPGIALPLGCVP